jgi:tripartite-type tricarboxylate transporter receptor subunit TctC
MRSSSRSEWRGGAVAVLFAAVVGATSCQSAFAQNYPTKPIRIIALSSPGSGPDIIGRLIGRKLTAAWGQQVIVDTRPGATGRIGAEMGAKSPPDGYTLVIVTSQAVIVSQLYEKTLKYSLTRDFAPIGMVATTPFLLVVHTTLPARSIKEFIALAKSKPGQIYYGSGGTGSPPHLSAEIFRTMTGIDIFHVPYKGVTPAMIDTIAGEVQMLISVIPAVLPAVKSGKVRALGVTSLKRSPLVPDIPTIAETVPGYEFIGWYSLVARAGTPPAIIAKLNGELTEALKTEEFRSRLVALGCEPRSSTPDDLAKWIKLQSAKMRKAIEDSGTRPE